MGSGELTTTMVEVHKDILALLGDNPKAYFLDTPAGFQLNADQLSQKAVEYFRVNVGHPMGSISFKSRDLPRLEMEKALHSLKEADYILVGPGSPTYAIRQWQNTAIPEIIKQRIHAGACLVAASAAALTVGRFTLPVYEIYKVGQDVHWVDGLDILGEFGFNLVVVPHWNNAEGGTHDTRFCFMGDLRFRKLEEMLPSDVSILGLDEHTACIIDLDHEDISIRGIGSVTLRQQTLERTFRRGSRFPLGVLSGRWDSDTSGGELAPKPVPDLVGTQEGSSFWDAVHRCERAFHDGLNNDPRDAINALLELDRLIWQAQQEGENEYFVSQAREILRECIVQTGTLLTSMPRSYRDCLAPLVEELLKARASFREQKRWQEADTIRDCLKRVGVHVDDTPEGYRWHLGA